MVIAILIALASGAFGAAASASNTYASPLTFVLNAEWAWGSLLFLAGRAARHWYYNAPIAGIAAIAAYYAADSVLRSESFAGYIPELRYWIVVSVVLGIALGACGQLSRRRTALGLIAGLLPSVGAIVEMIFIPRWAIASDANLDIARVVVATVAPLAGCLWIRTWAMRRCGRPSPTPDDRAVRIVEE